MRIRIFLTAFTLGLCLLVLPCRADDSDSQPKPPPDLHRLAARLHLTAQQTEQMRAAIATRQQKVEAMKGDLADELVKLLTRDQLARLQAMLGEGKDDARLQDMLAQLNLTQSQRADLREFRRQETDKHKAITAAFQAQLQTILTPQQYTEFRAIRARQQQQKQAQQNNNE